MFISFFNLKIFDFFTNCSNRVAHENELFLLLDITRGPLPWSPAVSQDLYINITIYCYMEGNFTHDVNEIPYNVSTS